LLYEILGFGFASIFSDDPNFIGFTMTSFEFIRPSWELGFLESNIELRSFILYPGPGERLVLTKSDDWGEWWVTLVRIYGAAREFETTQGGSQIDNVYCDRSFL